MYFRNFHEAFAGNAKGRHLDGLAGGVSGGVAGASISGAAARCGDILRIMFFLEIFLRIMGFLEIFMRIMVCGTCIKILVPALQS